MDSKVQYRFPLSFKRQSNLHFWLLFDEKNCCIEWKEPNKNGVEFSTNHCLAFETSIGLKSNRKKLRIVILEQKTWRKCDYREGMLVRDNAPFPRLVPCEEIRTSLRDTSSTQAAKKPFQCSFARAPVQRKTIVKPTCVDLRWATKRLKFELDQIGRKSSQVHGSRGETESQVNASFQLAITCDSVWPGLNRKTQLFCSLF